MTVGADGKPRITAPADPAARNQLRALAPLLTDYRDAVVALAGCPAVEPTVCPKCSGIWFCPREEIVQLAVGPWFCPRGRAAAVKDRTGKVIVPADPGCPYKPEGW